MERPHIVKPVNKGASTVTNIYCAAYMYAKQRQTLPDSETMGCNPEAINSVTKNAIEARKMVSCDQYQPTTRGRLQHTRGKERDSQKLAGGTIFVNHATKFVFTSHQTQLTAAATVESKHACKRKFESMGVPICQYLVENHPFRAKEWTEDCANQHQHETRYSGVGAHHQNLAECYIQTIFNRARAMMIHFVLNWPQMAQNQEHLWPFAVD